MSTEAKRCKNDRARTYKGSEPSPLGLGYAAGPEKAGSRKRGGDGAMWIAKPRSNGANAWVRAPSSPKRAKSRRPATKGGAPTTFRKDETWSIFDEFIVRATKRELVELEWGHRYALAAVDPQTDEIDLAKASIVNALEHLSKRDRDEMVDTLKSRHERIQYLLDQK